MARLGHIDGLKHVFVLVPFNSVTSVGLSPTRNCQLFEVRPFSCLALKGFGRVIARPDSTGEKTCPFSLLL